MEGFREVMERVNESVVFQSCAHRYAKIALWLELEKSNTLPNENTLPTERLSQVSCIESPSFDE